MGYQTLVVETARPMKYRGVNIGGWLILEKWMTPSLFEGLAAQDEYSYCQELGPEATTRLEAHRRDFITRSDLEWIKRTGMNAVRLPVPYWMFGDVVPFVGCADYVDWFVETCGDVGVQVLLDIHAAPGSQNGNDHSGRQGPIDWPQTENIELTLSFVKRLAERYGNIEQVLGFELLNEPDSNIEDKVLQDYYRRGLEIVRAAAPGKLVIISDAYRPKDWHGSAFGEESDVVLDCHLYQAFSAADARLDMAGHVNKAETTWRRMIDELEQTMPIVIGEWSFATGKGATGDELTAYAIAQLDNFNLAAGWFFWSYKTESDGPWNFRSMYEAGLIPPKLLQ